MEGTRDRFILLGSLFIYCLLGAEIIIMISPFALYFYSVYGPILKVLSASPWTAWLTEFFLPHLVFPNAPFLNIISYLQLCLVLGLLLFLTAAIPLYYGKFTGKKVVTYSYYRKIRHPQYLFLAVSGFGLLLYWPRFIILILYVTMLYVYYLLARNEEWRMKLTAPEAYRDYLRSTPMFLPGEPGGKVYRVLFGWIRPGWLGLATCFMTTLALSILLALGLRAYSLTTLPTVLERQTHVLLVSVFPRPVSEMQSIYRAALADSDVERALAARGGADLAYLMPGDFFLMALVTDENRHFSDDMIARFPEILEWHEHKFSGGLGKFFKIFYNFFRTAQTPETDYETERLIFVKTEAQDGTLVPPEHALALGLRPIPILLVDLDADSLKVRSVVRTSSNNKWGTLPMPRF